MDPKQRNSWCWDYYRWCNKCKQSKQDDDDDDGDDGEEEDEEDDDDSKAGVYDGGDGDERFQLEHVRAGSVALLSHHSGPNVA